MNNRNNHFQEQFEDSEANMSRVSYDNPNIGNMDGQPIQLIRMRPSGKIQLEEKALEIISNCDLPVGFVSLVGKYRTGKSFLMNKLLHLQNRGFKVDPSTTACTQGIWMWSNPVLNKSKGNYIFFLDTQGTDSLTKGPDNDAIIFTLACLLSSFFVFNSVGAIDERSIGQLNMVTSLSRNVMADQKLSQKLNQQQLSRYMPKFLWLLRDFTLQLRNQYGNKISSNQYLESVLHDQNQAVRINEDVKKIRRSLINYFKERQCMVLVRPARQQSDLNRFEHLPDLALRKQFNDGVDRLRQRILEQTGAKMYDGDPLYGASIVSMLEYYVDIMNKDGIPTIKTAWQHISDDQGAFAYNRAMQKYNQLYDVSFPDDQPKDDGQLRNILTDLRDITMSTFNDQLSSPNQAYQTKLKDFLNVKQKEIISINDQLNEVNNFQILKTSIGDLVVNIENNKYDGRQEALDDDIKKLKENYNKKAKGAKKGQTLAQFLANLYPIIRKSTQKKQVNVINETNQYNEKKLKQLEQKNKSLQNQINTQSRLDNQLPLPPKDKTKKDPKKSKGGCCGTECLIM